MMQFKLVLVSFPFDDLSSSKVRPALCITNFTSGYYHIVVSFITTQLVKNFEKSDLLIENTSPGFHETGLVKSLAICLHRLVTIQDRAIISILGTLPVYLQSEVKLKLKELFSL
jgi:mRNA interferase MazF